MVNITGKVIYFEDILDKLAKKEGLNKKEIKQFFKLTDWYVNIDNIEKI